jgi:H+-transporting ATPase
MSNIQNPSESDASSEGVSASGKDTQRMEQAELPAGVDLSRGLTSKEAAQRLAEEGENAIAEEHVSAFSKLLSFFWGPIPWMIEAASASGRNSRQTMPSRR